MFDTVITGFYIIVALAMVIQYLWITKPRSGSSTGESKSTDRYGLIDVAWIRDCRSNARNVLITSVVLVFFVLGNLFYLIHLASGSTASVLFEIASRDPIIVPIIIAFLVAVYQVLLGEIFFINLIKKIKGTDMWILWIFFLILISVIPSVIEVSSSDGSDATHQFYKEQAKKIGQFWFLGMMATAITMMYILWIYHALFVQLSVNDGFSLPQFVKNIRINILESIGRPRVLIQSVIIGPKKSGKSELRSRMADPLHEYEGEENRQTRASTVKTRSGEETDRGSVGAAEMPLAPRQDDQKLVENSASNLGTAGVVSKSEQTTADADDSTNGNVVNGVIAGTQKVQFGYRDIKMVSPLTPRGKRRSVQLCHYMLDCAGELLGDHLFLPISVRVDVLVVLIRAKALDLENMKVERKQYWTLRAIEGLCDQRHEQGRSTRDYFQGLYSATRSDDREFSFRIQYQPKSVVVVLNVEEDNADLLTKEEELLDMLKAFAEDVGMAFNIQNPSDRNCHAAILNAKETRPKEAYEKVLNIQISPTDTLE